MNIIEAGYIGKNLKIGIVISRFNSFITKSLLSGATDTLSRNGVLVKDTDVFWVPGAFEIPLITKKLINLKKYDAIITLGCVIRGDTSHYDYVCNVASSNIAVVSLQSEIPVIFGILTTESIEQAMERSGTKSGNKGSQAALDAIEMANLNKIIK